VLKGRLPDAANSTDRLEVKAFSTSIMNADLSKEASLEKLILQYLEKKK
jgi:hypothetical protein